MREKLRERSYEREATREKLREGSCEREAMREKLRERSLGLTHKMAQS